MGYILPFNETKTIGDNAVALIVKNKLHGCVELIINKEDIEKVRPFHWNVVQHNGKLYGRAHSKKDQGHGKSFVFIHRLILPGCKYVDHANGNPLDNRRENLRQATPSQNSVNRGYTRHVNTYRGVTRIRENRYQARISIDGKRLSLGYFKTEEDAAKAYNEASKKHHGEFGRLNNV